MFPSGEQSQTESEEPDPIWIDLALASLRGVSVIFGVGDFETLSIKLS